MSPGVQDHVSEHTSSSCTSAESRHPACGRRASSTLRAGTNFASMPARKRHTRLYALAMVQVPVVPFDVIVTGIDVAVIENKKGIVNGGSNDVGKEMKIFVQGVPSAGRDRIDRATSRDHPRRASAATADAASSGVLAWSQDSGLRTGSPESDEPPIQWPGGGGTRKGGTPHGA